MEKEEVQGWEQGAEHLIPGPREMEELYVLKNSHLKMEICSHIDSMLKCPL